tara:strand:- start:1416 stop:1853 length:438 start_codon:yes stop_codon:yes gene_type:complete
MIQDVIISKKKQFIDDRGKIMHMLRNDEDIFKSFGEIYFSCIFQYKVKAWHLHKKMTLNYSVIHGEIKLVLFDDRAKSSTKGLVQEIKLSPENHCVVTVPPLIWNGFISLYKGTSIVANCSDIPHDINEIIRKDFNDTSIPYRWK